MAQFTIDPADGATVLNDFTMRVNTGKSLQHVDDLGTPALFADRWFGFAAASYDPAGQVSDFEVVYRARRSAAAANQAPGAGGRINADGTLYGAASVETNDLRINAYVAGVRSNLGAAINVITDNAAYNWYRFRVSGSSLKYKSWADGASEPVGWQIELTNTQITAAGWVGLYNRSTNDAYYSFVGIGTNGDPAPTEAPSTGDNLSANDISSTSEVTSPAIAQTHALTANDISSLSSVSSPAITQTHSLIATDVQSTSQVSSPALATQANTDNLTADDIESASATSSPALGQVHNLSANDATSTSETGTSTLQQTHDLTSVDVSSLSKVSSPSLTSVAGQDSLAANDVQATSTVSSPTIGQVHNLTADDLSSASETDSPNLGQVHALTANDLASTSEISSPTLRDASQVLVTPIKNTKATVSQTTYKAAII